jgi:phosphoribosylamine--glycine ligase
VGKVFVAPGNAGTAREEGIENVPLSDHAKLVEFAKAEKIALTVVGTGSVARAGVVDAFNAAGSNIRSNAACCTAREREGFRQSFHAAASYSDRCTSDVRRPTLAHAYVEKRGAPIVIKADGLAAGKGVVVAATAPEAHAAIDMMLVGNVWVSSTPMRTACRHRGFPDGEEASFIVIADGRHALALATSQDHKRLGDGDVGPNTGGMVLIRAAPVVTPQLHARIMREVIQPAIAGMAEEGMPFTGFLYAGLMIEKRTR